MAKITLNHEDWYELEYESPTKKGMYLCYWKQRNTHEGKGFDIYYWNGNEFSKTSEYGYNNACKVFYWMELPDSPKSSS